MTQRNMTKSSELKRPQRSFDEQFVLSFSHSIWCGKRNSATLLEEDIHCNHTFCTLPLNTHGLYCATCTKLETCSKAHNNLQNQNTFLSVELGE